MRGGEGREGKGGRKGEGELKCEQHGHTVQLSLQINSVFNDSALDVTFDLPTIFSDPIIFFNREGFSSFVGVIFAGTPAANANVTVMDLNDVVLEQTIRLAGIFTAQRGFAGAYPGGMGI